VTILFIERNPCDYYEHSNSQVREDIHARLKMYGTIGDTLSDVIEDFMNYYEKREGKPQKKVNI
jgi:hypothetical protein